MAVHCKSSLTHTWRQLPVFVQREGTCRTLVGSPVFHRLRLIEISQIICSTLVENDAIGFFIREHGERGVRLNERMCLAIGGNVMSAFLSLFESADACEEWYTGLVTLLVEEKDT